MRVSLNLLLVEDAEQDAERVIQALTHAGLDSTHQRVANAASLRVALGQQSWAAVICAYSIPGFGGLEALRIVREMQPDTPFILVSGSIGEEIAIDALKAGASNYVMKSSLSRLASVLEREIKDAATRSEHRLAQRKLIESAAGLRRAQSMAKLCHVITGPQGAIETWSENLPALIGVDPGLMPESTRTWLELVHPDDRAAFRENAIAAGRARARTETEYRLRRADGTWIHVQQVSEPLDRQADDAEGLRWFNTLQDVSEQKISEEKICRLQRMYAMLSGINTLIVRVHTREELFKEACRIAVDVGKFRLAWIGIVDREGQCVQPVAWHGGNQDYVQAIPRGIGKAPAEHRGVVAQAVEERRPIVSEDMTRDPRMKLGAEAAGLGFRSLAVVPLLVRGEATGVFQLCASETEFFDEEEVALLLELAGDIGFAMEHIEVLGRMEYLAFHDPLTGLPRRSGLIDRVEQMLKQAARNKTLACVMFFDVERFRMVNDTLGRQAGDRYLQEIAERFKAATRAQDSLARIEGDIFAVAVSGLAKVSDVAHLVSDRLVQAFARPFVIDGTELHTALKSGIAIYPADGDTAEILCANAEAALRKAKSAGERVAFYTPEINARMAESLALENRLRSALDAGQFVLHYQPKVDAKTRALVGLEALIRWNEPELGLVPPGKFIPLMEETGIILEAGRWALGRAVSDIQAWRAKGYRASRVSVNVSALQLRQQDFVKSVLDALDGFGDAEPLLDLEITESMVMQNLEATVRSLQTLRSVGVETHLDDFGTGYSSLAYVARLPVAALKIDRSFVIDMTGNPYARNIVQTVISLGHALGLKVIAEGVDHEDQVKMLAAHGCDQLQGYLISKPVPFDQIEAMLSKA